MKQFPNTVETIKISFICDLCSVETTISVGVPDSGDFVVPFVCPACFKDFTITVCRGENGQDSTLTITDVDDADITITPIE